MRPHLTANWRQLARAVSNRAHGVLIAAREYGLAPILSSKPVKRFLRLLLDAAFGKPFRADEPYGDVIAATANMRLGAKRGGHDLVY